MILEVNWCMTSSNNVIKLVGDCKYEWFCFAYITNVRFNHWNDFYILVRPKHAFILDNDEVDQVWVLKIARKKKKKKEQRSFQTKTPQSKLTLRKPQYDTKGKGTHAQLHYQCRRYSTGYRVVPYFSQEEAHYEFLSANASQTIQLLLRGRARVCSEFGPYQEKSRRFECFSQSNTQILYNTCN